MIQKLSKNPGFSTSLTPLPYDPHTRIFPSLIHVNKLSSCLLYKFPFYHNVSFYHNRDKTFIIEASSKYSHTNSQIIQICSLPSHQGTRHEILDTSSSHLHDTSLILTNLTPAFNASLSSLMSTRSDHNIKKIIQPTQQSANENNNLKNISKNKVKGKLLEHVPS